MPLDCFPKPLAPGAARHVTAQHGTTELGSNVPLVTAPALPEASPADASLRADGVFPGATLGHWGVTLPGWNGCRVGEGAAPQPGDTCVVHWAGEHAMHLDGGAYGSTTPCVPPGHTAAVWRPPGQPCQEHCNARVLFTAPCTG